MIQYVVPFLLLGAVAFAATGKNLQKLKISIASLNFQNTSLRRARFKMDIIVHNPNKKGIITINEVDLSVVYRGNELTKISKSGLSIPVFPTSSSKIKDLQVDVDWLNAVNNVLSAFLQDYDKTILVKGVIKADGLKFPFEDTVDITKN